MDVKTLVFENSKVEIYENHKFTSLQIGKCNVLTKEGKIECEIAVGFNYEPIFIFKRQGKEYSIKFSWDKLINTLNSSLNEFLNVFNSEV